MELALPGDAGVLEVAHLVVQPLQALPYDGLVPGALVERGRHPVVVRRGRARSQRSRGVPQGGAGYGAEQQAEQQDQDGGGLHGPSMAATTDSGPARWTRRASGSPVIRGLLPLTVPHHPGAPDYSGYSARSTTTGAWSEAPLPARSSRSMNAPVTRSANGAEPSTKSIRRPRLRSKRCRK